MRVRFFDRLLAAVAGLLLLCAGLAFFLWAVGGIPAELMSALAAREISRPLFFAALGLGVIMVLLGAHSVSLVFRRQHKKGFVVQKTEHGQLSISIHAMENLVQKCIDKHEELTVVSNRIENTRDGVVVDLRIGLANGVSIPLVVSTLQKQIKQYITSCSGIDVTEVRVEVETASIKADNCPYAVPDTLLQTMPKAEPVEAPAPARVAEPPVPPVVPKAAEAKVPEFPEPAQDEKKRPLHQRLFGHKEQPAIVPMPPEMDKPAEAPAPAEDAAPEKEPEEIPAEPAAEAEDDGQEVKGNAAD